MVLNLFSELPVFVISVGSFITYKIANSLTFQVFVEIKWGNVCEVPSTVSCIQRLYSNLLIASIPPGTVSWGYLLYVLSRVYCLIFRMRREAPHGRMRAFFFLVTFTEQARGYSAQWFTPKVPFLSIWLFSIFQSSEYWPSFTDLSASSRHPVIHVISLKSFFFLGKLPYISGIISILQTKKWLRGAKKLAQVSVVRRLSRVPRAGSQALGLLFALPCRQQAWSVSI